MFCFANGQYCALFIQKLFIILKFYANVFFSRKTMNWDLFLVMNYVYDIQEIAHTHHGNLLAMW